MNDKDFIKKTFVVDIDGTICSTVDDGDYSRAVPFKERIKTLNNLSDIGHTIIYSTARYMGRTNNDRKKVDELYYQETEDQLISWGCKFDALFMGKPAGNFYVDDKAVHHNDFFLGLK